MDASTVGSTACSRRAADRLLALATLLLALGADPSWAQTRVDSAATEPAAIPLRNRALDAAGLLAGFPGGFVYDFGAAGWPDGWSPYGLDPRFVGAQFEAVPFEDPVTGAPVWELLPLAQMDPVQPTALARGRPDVVRTGLRSFDVDRPLTEMRYRSSGGGLQAVDVNHVQRRRIGEHTRATVLFGYGGAGAANEYDGSRLRRKRRIMGRVQIDRGDWSFGLGNLHNRQRLGAHGGVLPVPGYGYDSIYNRLLAEVDEPSARRVRIRNDLMLSAAGPAAGSLLDARLYWTTSTLQYRSSGDTTTARTSRLGLSAEWPVETTIVPLVITVTGHTDAVRSGDAFAGEASRTVTTNASLAARRVHGAWSADLAAGLGTMNGVLGPNAHAGVAWTAGPVRLHGSGTLAHVERPMVDRWGFGDTFVGLREAEPSRTVRMLGGAELRQGATKVAVEVFARSTSNPLLLLLDASADTVRVLRAPASLRARGVTISAAVRESATRGLYAQGSATWNAPLSETDDGLRRAQAALPEIHGRIRIGVRALLFEGDLDLDLAVQARAWSATAGRRLHAPTGLLALPEAASRDLPGSTILDITADAGVRSATIFLALENVLSGTTLVPGNQLVPDYPYPERRFRFGVYWPIFD